MYWLKYRNLAYLQYIWEEYREYIVIIAQALQIIKDKHNDVKGNRV